MRALSAALASAAAWSVLAGAALSDGAPSSKERFSAQPDSVAVVVYRGHPVSTPELMERSRMAWSRLDREGLALIVEKRVIDIPAGEGIVRFGGLATGIVPHSATIEGLPADILEQNADYDLITPQNLLERSVGQSVTVVRTNAANGDVVEQTGVLRAGAHGAVVEVDGRFEALDCSGLTERLVFEAVPAGLAATPTLSVKTRAAQAGRYEVTLAYLTTGLQWSADYVARVSPDATTVDLEGWITLANFGGTSFADAPVVVVAGDLSRHADTQPVEVRTTSGSVSCWPQQRTHEGWVRQWHGGPPPPPPPPAPPAPMMRAMADEIVVTANGVKAQLEELGDYKAYVLPHLTTVAARQTKQVLFLSQSDVAVEPVLVVPFMPAEDAAEPVPARLQLRARNDEASGLGLPVPQGQVAFYVSTPDLPTAYAGADQVSDTAVGLPLRLDFQPVPAVTGKVVPLATTTRGKGTRRRQVETYSVTLTNALAEAATLEMLLDAALTGAQGWRMEREGLRSQSDVDTGGRVWRLRLGAGQSRTFEVRWSYDAPE